MTDAFLAGLCLGAAVGLCAGLLLSRLRHFRAGSVDEHLKGSVPVRL